LKIPAAADRVPEVAVGEHPLERLDAGEIRLPDLDAGPVVGEGDAHAERGAQMEDQEVREPGQEEQP